MAGPLRRGRRDLRLVAVAPAKVNLVLRVGPPRRDGYHAVSTLMVPLDLADRVEVSVGRGRPGEVRCRVPGRPDLDGPANLAARAAEAFRLRFGAGDAVAIRINKRVPVTAGLGGGSSDAAAVIRCLARAYRVADRPALAALALEVGSDVPFFLGDGPAWATGRGERLGAARVPPLDLVLAHPRDPALAIRAGDAYRWLDDLRSGTPVRVGRLDEAPRFEPRKAANDLQAPCFARFPALTALRDRLVDAGAVSAIMSGSGPTVFGIFASRPAARRAAIAVRRANAGVEVYLARTVERMPEVASWRSPRSASFPPRRTSSRPT